MYQLVLPFPLIYFEDLQNIKGFVMYSEDSEKNEETEEEEWAQSQY